MLDHITWSKLFLTNYCIDSAYFFTMFQEAKSKLCDNMAVYIQIQPTLQKAETILLQKHFIVIYDILVLLALNHFWLNKTNHYIIEKWTFEVFFRQIIQLLFYQKISTKFSKKRVLFDSFYVFWSERYSILGHKPSELYTSKHVCSGVIIDTKQASIDQLSS